MEQEANVGGPVEDIRANASPLLLLLDPSDDRVEVLLRELQISVGEPANLVIASWTTSTVVTPSARQLV